MDKQVRPLSLLGSLILFGVPTVMLWLATRWGIPAAREKLHLPDLAGWFISGGAVFFCLFAAAFVAFWIEQGKITLDRFAERFQFRRLNVADVAWSVGLLVVCGILSGLITWLWRWASQTWTLLPEPQLAPPFMHFEALTRDTLWILLAWLPLFFFNIAGEELWWRGYILPRQEQQHQGTAYIVHGLGLAMFHLPLGIDLTIILAPLLFALPYVVQRRQNVWTSFILHGLLNGGGFLAVAFGLT